jgi:hypothetical protein
MPTMADLARLPLYQQDPMFPGVYGKPPIDPRWNPALATPPINPAITDPRLAIDPRYGENPEVFHTIYGVPYFEQPKPIADPLNRKPIPDRFMRDQTPTTLDRAWGQATLAGPAEPIRLSRPVRPQQFSPWGASQTPSWQTGETAVRRRRPQGTSLNLSDF